MRHILSLSVGQNNVPLSCILNEGRHGYSHGILHVEITNTMGAELDPCTSLSIMLDDWKVGRWNALKVQASGLTLIVFYEQHNRLKHHRVKLTASAVDTCPCSGQIEIFL